jgi:hypothetical protein
VDVRGGRWVEAIGILDRIALALLRHLVTRHDRHVLEALSTPASSDPVS